MLGGATEASLVNLIDTFVQFAQIFEAGCYLFALYHGFQSGQTR